MAKSHHGTTFSDLSDSRLIKHALRCLEKRLCYGQEVLSNSNDVCSYLQLHLAQEKNEVFAVLFLNNRHCLIAFEKLFFGTINEATIYPRVILQKALEHNATAIILAHNHPSNHCFPSIADQNITQKLRDGLKIFDIDVLDHIIVSHQECYSFAKHALM